jgi:hypothetical protein
LLNDELRVGARYPESRTGNMNASVVTGQGVQALLGAFDTQIKSAQAIFTTALRQVISYCFEIDEKLFDEKKTIRGVDAGSPYQVIYQPSKDIKQDYSSDVRYGMLAGLNPAQGLIFMLQALGGGLISKDMAMRELPFGVNVTLEQEKIEIEKMRDALVGSMASMAQAIPQMATQGQDPTRLINQMAEIINMRKQGKTIEAAVQEVFKPENPPAGAAQQSEQPVPAAPGAEPAGGAQPMMPPQAPQRPELQTLLSGMTGAGATKSSVRLSQQRRV